MLPARLALRLIPGFVLSLSICSVAGAQETAAPPAYLAAVDGSATLERDGAVQPAVRNMPFVAGDRLRTQAGRVEIDFPDGTAIEVGADSEVEALSSTRVRLLAGTMDHLQPRGAQTDSAGYLPQDLQRYGQTFDQNGSWNYDASYGYVWYPRVAADWRPYYYGSWSDVPSYGWTWVGLDPFSWPTHHYGRWGYARNAWFWIPGRAWSAAWVSWGLATDYVSWCPLGFDGRPVFALSVGFGGRGWNGWTVMARNHFGYRGAYAHTHAIDPRRFDARTSFVQTARLPLTLAHDRGRGIVESRGSVVGRSVTAPTTPGRVAVPRGSAADGRSVASERRTSTADYRRTPPSEPRTPYGYRPAVPPTAAVRTAPASRSPAPESRRQAPEYRRATPEYRRPMPESGAPAQDYRRQAPEYRRPAQESRPSAAAPREWTRAPERATPAPRAASAERAAPRGAPSSGPHDGSHSGGRPESSGHRPR